MQLQVSNGTQADDTFLYFSATATSGFDPTQDAAKLNNPSGLSLASLAGNEALVINGLPLLAQSETIVPLRLTVPTAGTYTFRVQSLPILPTGTALYLRDTQTGAQQLLTNGSSCTVQITAVGSTAASYWPCVRLWHSLPTPRWKPARLALYPNPAQGQFTVVLPPVAGQLAVQATLLNALGQIMQSRTIPLTAAGAIAEYQTTNLAPGVYTLRLEANGPAVTRRVVVE